jgi:YggT family protein
VVSDVIFDILFVLNVILMLYIFLLTIRIVLTWFSPSGEPFSGISPGRAGFTGLGRPWELLCKATDPYLGLFYRLKFLRRGFFDFTPVAAVLVLLVARDLVSQLATYHRISLGFFLASLTSAVWSGVSFLLLFFLLVGVLRTIPILFSGIAGSPLWKVVDLIIQPVVSLVLRTLRLAKRIGYTQYLLITLGILFAAWLLLEILVRQLIQLFRFLSV